MEMNVNRGRLFLASCMALVVTAMTFAIRARLELVFSTDFSLSAQDIGLAFGPAFFGFTIAMMIGGPLVDIFGIKKIVWLAFIGHLIGIIVTIFATNFWTLFLGTLAIGIGNGMVEAACNPLVATMYPEEKTTMLNRFHVWFPGGIVIGSLLSYLMMDIMELNWQLLVGALVIPLIAYAVLFLGQEVPQTERVKMGVSTSGMWKAVVSPLFLFMGFCMLLTASTELATQQRIDSLLHETGVSGMLVLALTTGIMAVGRAFAGPVVHKLSPSGMLLFSAVFSCLGLVWLSYAQGSTIFVAAAVFAIGVCYFWPTMLGYVAEYIPESGALGLSVMGGLGMFSVSIVLPLMGYFMDTESSGASTLRYMAILPVILIIAFSFLHFGVKKKKNEAVSA
ncbi:MFS transporter [Flexithrix dorotheae]|uniref:MFS transporter n=1 Tax=Flexithrix dorotheae TaxID=70993 RepID=UPI0003765C7B|nr:MFS transporter [Flexithrix dorotheae]